MVWRTSYEAAAPTSVTMHVCAPADTEVPEDYFILLGGERDTTHFSSLSITSHSLQVPSNKNKIAMVAYSQLQTSSSCSVTSMSIPL